jgi:hypothetical protein
MGIPGPFGAMIFIFKNKELFSKYNALENVAVVSDKRHRLQIIGCFFWIFFVAVDLQ